MQALPPIEQLRADTPSCQEKIHLNNAGAALMPQVVFDTMRDFLEFEYQVGGYEAMALTADKSEHFYQSMATLLHAKAHQIAYSNNATDAYNKALSSIPFKDGDVIVTSDDDYVANQLAFLHLQKYRGVQIIRAAKLASGGVDVNAVEALLKKHRPKLVAITHVPTNSGLVQEVEAIGDLCAAHDIWYLVDACQSVGQMPVDVNKIKCDFLSGTSRKFLRGPRGAGFLYVSQKAIDAGLEPVFPDLRGSDWVAANAYQLHPNARRYEIWERNYGIKYGFAAAVDYALALGMEAVEQRIQTLANYTREKIQGNTILKCLDKGKKRCGITSYYAANADVNALTVAMANANINVSVAQPINALIDMQEKGAAWALRIAPHYYNTKEEIDQVVAVLKNL